MLRTRVLWLVARRAVPPARQRWAGTRPVGGSVSRISEFMMRRRAVTLRARPVEYSVATVFGHLSFVLLAASYGFTDILDLRLMAVAAGVCTLAFNYWHPHGIPLWMPFRWNLLFIITNGIQIVHLLTEARRARSMSSQQLAVFEQVFQPAGLSLVDFWKLVSVANVIQVSEGAHLCYEGAFNPNVLLVVDGKAEVVIRGTKVYELHAGQFIGEMGIHVGLRLSNAMKASATVTALTETTCMSWPRGVLIDLLESNDAIARAVQSAISADIVRKLTSKDDSEILVGKSLHWKCEKQYAMLLERVLEKQFITAHERNMLNRYRILHDIDQGTHVDVLKRLGWTAEGYADGSGDRKPDNPPAADQDDEPYDRGSPWEYTYGPDYN